MQNAVGNRPKNNGLTGFMADEEHQPRRGQSERRCSNENGDSFDRVLSNESGHRFAPGYYYG